MIRPMVRVVFVAALLSSSACNNDSTGVPDAASDLRAQIDAHVDSKPDASVKPDVSKKPDASAKPDASKPDASAKPDTSVKLDASKPEASAKPDTSVKLDVSKPDTSVKLDASKPDASASTDPFDPASCGGSPMTTAQADVHLGTKNRVGLATATLMVRTRSCSGGTCGPWGAAQPHVQQLCTYSGGVVTRYKTFSFPTTFTLWKTSGKHQLTVQHTSEVTHCPACVPPLGMTFLLGSNPATTIYPQIHIFDPFPQTQWDYQDFDVTIGKDAELVVTSSCARFTSLTYDSSTQFAALYIF